MLALGERDPDSVDFAVAPEAVRAEVHAAYPTLEEIGNEARALRQQVRPQDQASMQRAAFLDEQLDAMVARVTMLRRRTFPFDQEANLLFATGRLHDTSADQREKAREQVLALLPPSMDKKESPARRYAAYDRRFLVPPERLKEVMTAALNACRAKTREHLLLPDRETVDLTFVRNQPWSAFSRYRGGGHSTIQLNLDLPVTVDDALELACHEGYPGHHVFNTLREAALVKGKGWAEANVQATFSPQSFISEAAAAYAPRLAFSESERAAVERDVLFPLAGLPAKEADRYVRISSLVRTLQSAEPAIAAAYLDGSLEFVRAEQELARETLMDHAEATLLYLNEYRSYMLAYTDGERRVSERVEGPAHDGSQAVAERWIRYRMLTSSEASDLLADTLE